MTENKICPFMYSGFMEPCIKDQCMAWRSAIPEEKMNGKSWDALVDLVALQEGYPHDLAEDFCKDRAKGYCRLIEDLP